MLRKSSPVSKNVAPKISSLSTETPRRVFGTPDLLLCALFQMEKYQAEPTQGYAHDLD